MGYMAIYVSGHHILGLLCLSKVRFFPFGHWPGSVFGFSCVICFYLPIQAWALHLFCLCTLTNLMRKIVSQAFMFFGLLEHLVCLVCLHPSWTQTQSMTLTSRRKQPNMPPAWKNWILQNTKGLYAEEKKKRRVCACKWSDEGGIEGIPFTISLGGCGKLCAADDRDAGCKLFKLPVYRAFLTLLYLILPYVSQRPWKKEEKEYTALP